MIKINILYNIVDVPTGGGNQFLRNLKKELEKKNCYASPDEADVIIFNSHHYIKDAVKLKQRFPDKIFVHRVAGPIKMQVSQNDHRDNIVYIANKYLADATVFQSNYSMSANIQQKIPRNQTEIIITNSTDNNIFNRSSYTHFDKNRKIKLVATSWSNNMIKGFKIYDYLDKNLDFNHYQMSFVGNSPIKFNNINMIPPLDTNSLSCFLKKQDIYITACKNEPCSNALIEALMCGLPALCLNSGSNPEVLGNGGLLFNEPEEIPGLLEKLVNNYQQYQDGISCQSMGDIANQYIELAESLVKKRDFCGYKIKHINFYQKSKIYGVIWYAQL